MTSNYHTPILSSPKQPANAETINAPLSELDAELSAQNARIIVLDGDSPPYTGNLNEFLNGAGGFSVPPGTGSTNGHVIQNSGVDFPQHVKLNFSGDGVSVIDEVDATRVIISGDAVKLAGVTPTAAGTALLDDADVAAQRMTLELGTAATFDVGVTANKVVQLDGGGKLPAVDGSQLIGVGGSASVLETQIFS